MEPIEQIDPDRVQETLDAYWLEIVEDAEEFARVFGSPDDGNAT